MRKLLVSILFLLSLTAFAQSDFMLSQQFFSRINQNPAATGSSDYLNIFYMHRQQWAGFDGAPTTNLLNAHTYLEKISSGIGLVASFDEIGLSSQSVNAKLAYAYYLRLGRDKLLSFGVSGGILYKSIDAQKLTLPGGESAAVYLENESTIKPDVDLGVEFSTPFILIGAAANHILNTKDDVNSVVAPPAYLGYVRANFGLGQSFDIAPAFSYRNLNYQTNLFEASLTAFYKKMIWLGGGYRFGQKASTPIAMVGVEYGMFRIGYGYEYTSVKGWEHNSTHELLLSLRIPNSAKYGGNQRAIRFMD
jgi:type IX secretion system PorP/SprF family membrane protein